MKKLLIMSFFCFLSLASLANEDSVPGICQKGFILGDNGNCYSCNALKKFTPKKLADCSNLCKTNDGTYIRKSDGFDTCELITCPEGYQKDTWGDCKLTNDECPENAPLKDIHGNCYPCSELDKIKLKNEADCESKCQVNGTSTRKITFWGCELKKCPDNAIKDTFGECIIEPKDCPETHPLREGASCYNCSYKGVIDMSPNDVHLCESMCKDEQENPTRKLYKNAGCGLINCPPDKPLKARGSCYSCDEITSIQGTKNCDICQEKRITIHTKGAHENFVYCALSSCPNDKPLRDVIGNCHSCDEEDEVGVKPGACTNICKNRIEKNPEFYHPILYTDPEAKLCILTSSEKESNALFSIKIKEVNKPQKLSEPKFKQSHCPEDKPLMDYQGGCYACDDPSEVTLDLSDLCFKCPNRYFRETMHFIDDDAFRRYNCIISNENSPKIKRVGNVDYYYNKDNQLEEEIHHLTDHKFADEMVKSYNKKGYSKTLKKLGKPIEIKYYHNNGKLKSEAIYKEDGLDEKKYYYYYDNGALKSIIPYKNKKISNHSWKDVKEGIGLWYYETGELKSMIPYKDGKFNGEYKRYTKQGKVREIGVYKDGKVISKRKIQ